MFHQKLISDVVVALAKEKQFSTFWNEFIKEFDQYNSACEGLMEKAISMVEYEIVENN